MTYDKDTIAVFFPNSKQKWNHFLFTEFTFISKSFYLLKSIIHTNSSVIY